MTDRHHFSRLLKPKELNLAIETFNKIIMHFDVSQTNDSGYKPATLIDLMRNGVSEKDEFLGLVFAYIQQDLLDESGRTDLDPILSHLAGFCNWSAEEKDKLSGSLSAFARYLVDNFFLPLYTFVVKTPQPTPAPSHRGTAIGTLQRVSTLRRDCLHRDRHRCVITRKFDAQEAKSRYKKDRCNLKDDEGKSLLPERIAMTYLEVAHIIPHPLRSLIGKEGERKPTDSNQSFHRILKLFNPSAIHLINRADMDRPMNALTLTRDLHTEFGSFEIVFELVYPQSHTYKIDYVNDHGLVRKRKLRQREIERKRTRLKMYIIFPIVSRPVNWWVVL